MKTLTLFSSLTALSTARLDFSWPNFNDSGMKFIPLIFYAVVSLAINKAMSVQLMNEEMSLPSFLYVTRQQAKGYQDSGI